MTRTVLTFLFALSLCATCYSQTKLKSKLIASCCDVGGRCTGSSYCTACTNCSGCKHCAQNGGSCGVCSGGSSRSSFTSTSSSSRTTKSKKRNSSYSNSKSASSPTYGFYDDNTTTASVNDEVLKGTIMIVKTSMLNVRTGPGTNYPVIIKLEKGDYVRCIESTKGDWVKVEVVPAGVEGYVYKKNLE